ncbi:hypothetical protein RFI_21920 [Reticulomyxa filosa]|uniref:Uncharacterized protein n=1 Tax=Reticulomyxa filosa TaxID=46433 RepID=X6MNN5_RETFI|nr:hypothetical protein RFI_21920 [Reticulomyxa filosa]|eukprot:ETO15444.1 hypothetical protein RFI_21920 [Reticulomyxa filosa]
MSDQSKSQNLKELPIPLSQSQCVLHKHELLICGGWNEKNCYSYHTLKNEYEFICSYPKEVKLLGHCVVKLLGNKNNKDKDNNEITLLSFGGNHVLLMKYVSVWSNNNDGNEMDNSKKCNQWVPFTDNHNNPIHFGEYYENYGRLRALNGGSNNHLLFITYKSKDISVFDLNTFQFIKHNTLPIETSDWIWFHCFVSKLENRQEIMKTNEAKNKSKQNKNYQMMLFHWKTGLSIEYDEDNNTFQFHQLPVCNDIASFKYYAYACTNDAILFFGGWNGSFDEGISKLVHKYLIQENMWITFKHTLPIALYDCFAVLNEDNNHIHIIGGSNDKHNIISTHMKTKASRWRDASHLSNNEIKLIIQYWNRILKIKLGWIDELDKIVIKYDRMKNSIYDIYKSLKIISFFIHSKRRNSPLNVIAKKFTKKKKKANNCFRL